MKRLCKEQKKLPDAGDHLTSAATPLSSTAFRGWRFSRIPRAAALGLIVAMSVPAGAQAQVSDQALADPGRGPYGKAISLLERNLEVRERTLGKEHPFKRSPP